MPGVSARQRSWLRRHDGLVIGAIALVAFAMLAGYNVYAARVSHRNAVAVTQVKKLAPKVTRLTKGQCGQTRFLYAFLNALAEDSSPAFGSPPDGPPIPGARDRLIGRLYDVERASLPRLKAQGCKVPAPPR